MLVRIERSEISKGKSVLLNQVFEILLKLLLFEMESMIPYQSMVFQSDEFHEVELNDVWLNRDNISSGI